MRGTIQTTSHTPLQYVLSKCSKALSSGSHTTYYRQDKHSQVFSRKLHVSASRPLHCSSGITFLRLSRRKLCRGGRSVARLRVEFCHFTTCCSDTVTASFTANSDLHCCCLQAVLDMVLDSFPFILTYFIFEAVVMDRRTSLKRMPSVWFSAHTC